MVKIIIENLAQKEVPADEPGRTVVQHILDHRVDWLHACGNKGKCTTCKMEVLEGLENMNPETRAESGYRQQGLLKTNERLACQVKITGTIVIRVPKEAKLHHLTYTD
jgi:2Fe-2S ferredoxin